MPTKKTKSLKSTTKSVEVKKVVTGKGIPDKEPDIKISDDVVSALVNGFKDLSERLDKLVENVSHISMMYDSFANGESSLGIWVANDYSIPISVEAFRDDVEVAVYNCKNTNFSITGSIDVNGDLTVNS